MTHPAHSTVTAAEMENLLRAAFEPETLLVSDDSHEHAGHAGAGDGLGGTHFSVHIRARSFAGLTHVQRHRLVYDALRSLIDRGVHALAIKAEPV